jgi:DNA-binding PadR family transcriptional regulator
MFNRRRGLRMWILSLLDKSPKNGAEIMDSIEEMSQGWWRPSPGSIYPLLSELEQEGYIRKLPDGRYELTEKSREEVPWPPWARASRPQRFEDMLNEIESYVSYFEDLSKSDKKKFGGYADQIIKLRDRLSAMVREGGEKA